MAALYTGKLCNQFCSLRNQSTLHDATTGLFPSKWGLRNECRNSILISWGRKWWCHEISAVFSGYNFWMGETSLKFYIIQTVWFWALLGWTDSNSILTSRGGSTSVSSILRKSVRLFIINILLIIKNTFQVETWPISCLNDSETQDRGLYRVKIQNISWGSLPLGPC